MTKIPTVYEKIRPFYLTSAQKLRLQNGIAKHGYEWTNSNFSWYKEILKRRLRNRQHDLCCYCRRLLRYDKGLVEIEHVINKSKTGAYDYFTFELKNLALSCKDCNNGKGTKSVLSNVWTAAKYPSNGKPFDWVHPYYHDYSSHITIHKAWVYEANAGSPQGLAVITKCKLKDLKDKERRNRKAVVLRAVDFEDALKRAVAFSSEVNLDQLCRELAPHLAKLMKVGADINVAAQAIRDASSKLNAIALAAGG